MAINFKKELMPGLNKIFNEVYDNGNNVYAATARYSHGWTNPRDVFGTNFECAFDIEHSHYTELEKYWFVETEALRDLWVVKFGSTTTAQDIQDAGDEWRAISHILWKRGALLHHDDIATATHRFAVKP